MKSMVLFNNKGGVGKTTLSFNLAHILARLGKRVVVLDFDPQCNMSSILLGEEELMDLWEEDEPQTGVTVAACIDRVRRGKGELRNPVLREVADNLWCLPGHLSLGRFEQPLAEEWPKVLSTDNERALDVTTALDELSNRAAEEVHADLVLLDVGPSLGALNRAALLACDAVVIPVAPDLFSLQGLRNAGPTLSEWRTNWLKVVRDHLAGRPQLDLPVHEFRPIGYLVQQHLARVDRPVRAYRDWADRIPAEYHRSVLEEPVHEGLTMGSDGSCLGSIKHFGSLAPYAQAARKPLFDLKQADGVGGGQLQAVARCRGDFIELAARLMDRLGVVLFPEPTS